MSEELKFLSRQLRYERDEKDREISRLRAALRKCDDGLNYLIAESDAFLVDDLQKMIKEALGDE